MDQRYEKIIQALGEDRVSLDEPMANHTTFKIGGPADLFFVAETEEELIKAVGVAGEIGVPFFILGGGSNLLVGDKGFRGVVINFQFSIWGASAKQASLIFNFQETLGGVLVTAGAGMRTSDLVNKLAKNSITGLEFMAGIPGTVGGAVRGNAGAWQQNFGDKVTRVKVLTSKGKVEWREKAVCQFEYRHSRFKRSEEIVLEAELKLAFGKKEEIQSRISEILEKRSTLPKEPSAGSVFVNPKPLKAGEMIDECGLKGKQIGGARISEAHANFIVNTGEAKAADVVALIDLIKAKVKEKFEVDLKEEIVRIGEF